MPWQVYNSAGQLLQATDLPDNAVTNAKVADDAIGVAELSATGTASSSVFLRGDNAWGAAGGTAPVFGRVARTSGSVTTTSTSLVDITGATVTLTTGAFPVQISVAQSTSLSVIDNMQFNIDVDSGTLLMGSQGMLLSSHAANMRVDASFSVQTAVLSAASHTFKAQWKVDAGTGTVYADSNFGHQFSVHEIR